MPVAVVAVAAGVVASALGVDVKDIFLGGLETAGKLIKKALGVPDVESQAAASQTLEIGGAFAPRMIVGEAVVSGRIVKYYKAARDDKEYHHFFLNLAAHPCTSVTPYQIDGKQLSGLSGSGYLIEPRLGDQTGPTARALQYMPNVDSSFIGTNVTDIYAEFVIDPEIFPNGLQDLKMKVEGLRVYDPRKDSTGGGDGLHRIDDESTWEHTRNGALINFYWKLFKGGVVLPLEMFTMSNIAEQANICDELVNTLVNDETVLEPRYQCDGVFDLTDEPESVEQALLSSCEGAWIESAGQVILRVAAFQGPAIGTITQADCAELPKRRPHTPLSNRCNRVHATFISKDHFYQATDMTPIESGFLVNNRDRGVTYTHDLQLNFTNSNTMAQRLAVIHLQENAAGDTIELALNYTGLRVRPGTVWYLYFPEILIDGIYEAQSAGYDLATNKNTVSFRETSADIYNQLQTPASVDVTPNIEIDNTVMAAVTNIVWTPTPTDSFRQGLLSWTHPVPTSVRRYIALLTKASDNTFSRVFYPTNASLELSHLADDDYTVSIAAENRFEKTSEGVTKTFNIGLPSTPSTALAINVLPGRVEIVGPAIPHANASYDWRYNFFDDFDTARVLPRGTGALVTGTPHNGTLYLWYRLVDGDLVDVSFLQVVVPNLIGLSTETIDPESIASVVLPGFPSSIADTLFLFHRALTEQEYYGEELALGQKGLALDIAAQAQKTDDVETLLNTVSTTANNAASSAQQALVSISGAEQARALSETLIAAEFDNVAAQYLKQADLFTSAGAARASDLTLLQTQLGDTSVASQVAAGLETGIGYLDENDQWIVGAPFATSFNTVTVQNAAGENVSVFQFLEALETETGELKGRLQFGVDQDGRVTQQIIDGQTSSITFAMETAQFVKTNGDLVFGLDANGDAAFYGSGQFTGTVRAEKLEVIGNVVMEITDPAGFGPDNLFYWYGFTLLASNGDVDYDSLTKMNALDWKDLEGNSPLNVSSNINVSGKSTLKTLNPSIEVGPFASQGNQKTLVLSFNLSAADITPGACSTSPMTQPTLDIALERKVGSGGWNSIQNFAWSGSATRESEGPECLSFESVTKSATVYDNNTSVDDITYRAVVTNQTRFHVESNVNSQILNLSVSES